MDTVRKKGPTGMADTMTLVLIRHGQSEYNLKNLFCGWMDAELSDTGREEAKAAGQLLRDGGFDFDQCYTSYLKRAIHTLNIALDEMDRAWLPVTKSWRLNERHYGALQNLNKAQTAEKYGDELVHTWRRSYDVRPPALDPDDPRSPLTWRQYEGVPQEDLPLAECLKDTVARVQPLLEGEILPDMRAGKRVLVVAHGNSLRALVKVFDGLSDDAIADVNIPTGVPLVYTFDGDMKAIDHHYLGDPDDIAARTAKTASTGAKH